MSLDTFFRPQTADYRFLTFRSPTKQTIGKVSDHLRKISDEFFLVREEDKRIAGSYHFHAIAKLKNEPPRSWYTKGTHINLKKIGRSDSTVGMVLPPPDYTSEEKSKIAEHCEPQVIDEIMFAHVLTKHLKRSRMSQNMERVKAYIMKDFQPTHKRYVDYILMLGGKSAALPDKNGDETVPPPGKD